MKNVRTRFAPSPTGYIHVGNVRSALYPYLLARQAYARDDHEARFILRIEDTDQTRFVDGAEELIIDTLKWLGVSWDEGPAADSYLSKNAPVQIRQNSVGQEVREIGPYGPYHQTSRREIYYKYAQKLIDDGFAYADSTSADDTTSYRAECEKNGQPFLFRNIRPDNPAKWTPGTSENPTLPLRFKVRELKKYHWHDEVFGDLSAGAEVLDDFILIKSDGLPTYNFAHIVDDNEMKISHVIRGQEYISSMPRYLALYDALDIDWPIFAHLPHILGPDGKKKLGKRDGAKSVSEYRTDGILPEAMLNFLALLGWNPGNGSEQEIFTLNDLVEQFDLSHVQKSGARFDERHLVWLNGAWIRNLAAENFVKLSNYATEFWGDNAKSATPELREKVLRVVADRLKTLCDLPVLSEYFFARPTPDWTMVDNNKQLRKVERATLVKLLKTTKTRLNELSERDFQDKNKVQSALNELLESTGQKPAVLFSMIRFALTWAPFSPGLPETMMTLAKDETLNRLDAAIKQS
ncbi:MAG: glutamate--tRNA ligase [Candidatus Nanoperiomorbaceae bacterium]